jgi:hypothetical protein
MTTITRAPASPKEALPELDLDARLALVGLAMDDRLDRAAVAYEVNTAHIPASPRVEITIPHLPQTAIPCPYRTPIAAILWHARGHLEQRGWCRDALSDDQGAICLMEAVQLAAPGSDLVWPALGLLLEVIRREIRDAESVPDANDRCCNRFMAFRFLDQAAQLASDRNL